MRQLITAAVVAIALAIGGLALIPDTLDAHTVKKHHACPTLHVRTVDAGTGGHEAHSAYKVTSLWSWSGQAAWDNVYDHFIYSSGRWQYTHYTRITCWGS